MALDNIAVTVREGDSFDELYLNIEKPWVPYNYSNSVLVADIRRFFNDNTSPASAVDSFGIVELDPAKGQVALKLTSRQTEALGRNVPVGYTERGLEQTGLGLSVDVSDELQGSSFGTCVSITQRLKQRLALSLKAPLLRQLVALLLIKSELQRLQLTS